MAQQPASSSLQHTACQGTLTLQLGKLVPCGIYHVRLCGTKLFIFRISDEGKEIACIDLVERGYTGVRKRQEAGSEPFTFALENRTITPIVEESRPRRLSLSERLALRIKKKNEKEGGSIPVSLVMTAASRIDCDRFVAALTVALTPAPTSPPAKLPTSISLLSLASFAKGKFRSRQDLASVLSSPSASTLAPPLLSSPVQTFPSPVFTASTKSLTTTLDESPTTRRTFVPPPKIQPTVSPTNRLRKSSMPPQSIPISPPINQVDRYGGTSRGKKKSTSLPFDAEEEIVNDGISRSTLPYAIVQHSRSTTSLNSSTHSSSTASQFHLKRYTTSSAPSTPVLPPVAFLPSISHRPSTAPSLPTYGGVPLLDNHTFQRRRFGSSASSAPSSSSMSRTSSDVASTSTSIYTSVESEMLERVIRDDVEKRLKEQEQDEEYRKLRARDGTQKSSTEIARTSSLATTVGVMDAIKGQGIQRSGGLQRIIDPVELIQRMGQGLTDGSRMSREPEEAYGGLSPAPRYSVIRGKATPKRGQSGEKLRRTSVPIQDR